MGSSDSRHVYMTTTQQLVKVFTTYFTSRGYHKTKSEKFELHSKPYITVDTEQEAIQILVTRKISKILECCNSNDLDIDNSVLYNNYVLVLTLPFQKYFHEQEHPH